MNFNKRNEFYKSDFVLSNSYNNVLSYLRDIHRSTITSLFLPELKHFGNYDNVVNLFTSRFESRDAHELLPEHFRNSIYASILQHFTEHDEEEGEEEEQDEIELYIECIHEGFRNLCFTHRDESCHEIFQVLEDNKLSGVVKVFREFMSIPHEDYETTMLTNVEFGLTLRCEQYENYEEYRDILILMKLEIEYLKVLKRIHTYVLRAKSSYERKHIHYMYPFVCRLCHQFFQDEKSLHEHLNACEDPHICASTLEYTVFDEVPKILCYKCFKTSATNKTHKKSCSCKLRRSLPIWSVFHCGRDFGQYFNSTHVWSHEDLLCMLNLTNTTCFNYTLVDRRSIHYPWENLLDWSKRKTKVVHVEENSSMLLFGEGNQSHFYIDEKDYIEERSMNYFPYITHFALTKSNNRRIINVTIGVLFDVIQDEKSQSNYDLRFARRALKSLNIARQTHLVRMTLRQFWDLFFTSYAVQERFGYFIANFQLSKTLSTKIKKDFTEITNDETNQLSEIFLQHYARFERQLRRSEKNKSQSTRKRKKKPHAINTKRRRLKT